MISYEKAIEKTKQLFKTRTDPSWWSANIIEGSEGLETKLEWKHYYSYICDPHKYDPEKIDEVITLDDLHVMPEIKKFDYGPEFTVKEYKNGCETFVRVRKNSL